MSSILGVRPQNTELAKIERRRHPLAQYGLGYTLRVLLLLYVVPVYARLLVAYMRKYKRLVCLLQEYTAPLRLAQWRMRRDEIVRAGHSGYRLNIEELGLEPAHLTRLQHALKTSPQVILGEIDQQGRLFSNVGPIPYFRMVQRAQFKPRKPFAVRLVVLDGVVGIQKSYAGRLSAFLNELDVLHRLAEANCHVPAILDVDFEKKLLTTSYIRGRALRDELEQRGACLKTEEISNAVMPSQMSRNALIRLRSGEGKQFLSGVLDAKKSERLFDRLRHIHAASVVGNDIKYGNVILEARSGEPYWIDFDHAFHYTNGDLPAFRLIRDRDIEKFNVFFATEHISYRRLQKIIQRERAQFWDDWTTPVYFGSGLALGSLWNVDAGFGCWEGFLKHHLPAVQGKRILDLFANNAFYSLQMVRRGAHVVALEPSAKYHAQAKLVKAGLEWGNNTRYPLEWRARQPYELTRRAMGTFDMVTALHGVRGVDREAAAKLVQHITTLADSFVLYRGFVMPDGATMPSEECAQILRENGFPDVDVIEGGRNPWRLYLGRK